jgi:hypothetical protein
MITEEKAIKALQKRLDALLTITQSQKFSEWKTRTLQTLAHIYGAKHTSYMALNEIRGYSYVERTPEAKSEAIELLNGLIEDLQNFGFPKPNDSSNNGLNVLVNQHNNQNQSTSISINIDFIIDVLKEELRNSEIEEVKEILESKEELKEKKKKFIDKIKSFGSDVASNVLANILTNPQVYGKLGGML